jgi:hypothetical protein
MRSNWSIICSLLIVNFISGTCRSKTVKKSNLCPPFAFLAHCKVIIIPADGKTDVTKLIVAFRKFANARYCTSHEIYTSSSESDTDLSIEKCLLMFMPQLHLFLYSLPISCCGNPSIMLILNTAHSGQTQMECDIYVCSLWFVYKETSVL